MAKEEKYRSRAAYKLLESVKKHQFIKPGDVVVDLGAAPGGWTQASQKTVGEKGFVLGVDLKQMEPFDSPNVLAVVGDITDSEITQQVRELLPRSADVVISDVSPNVSGVWEVDQARQIDLARQSLRIAKSLLKPKGNFFVKVFQGELLDDFVKELKRHFADVRIVKPKASRPKSAELYLLAIRLKKIGEVS